jgi:signal recognition particle receptor subunit beta
MAFIDLKNSVIQAKVVYYGPGRGGKTTNLEYIYKTFRQRIKSEMVSIKTHGDRTLFFDFLPFSMGRIRDYDVRIQLYTVPGQVKYNATRQLVLKGVDGVVFVADSSAGRRDHNRASLKNLKENLEIHGKRIDRIPLVIQYNKRDLEHKGPMVLDVEAMESDLNGSLRAPAFPASALHGQGVVPTLKKVISKTVAYLIQELS